MPHFGQIELRNNILGWFSLPAKIGIFLWTLIFAQSLKLLISKTCSACDLFWLLQRSRRQSSLLLPYVGVLICDFNDLSLFMFLELKRIYL